MNDKLDNGGIVKPNAYPLIGGDCVFPIIDHLATLLAAEEHRQGAPYVADAGHCERCAEVDLAWAQAVCEMPGSYLRFDRRIAEAEAEQIKAEWNQARRHQSVMLVPPTPPLHDNLSLGEYFGPEPHRPDPGHPQYTGDLWLSISRWWAWYAGPTLLGLGIVAVMVLMWFWLVVWR